MACPLCHVYVPPGNAHFCEKGRPDAVVGDDWKFPGGQVVRVARVTAGYVWYTDAKDRTARVTRRTWDRLAEKRVRGGAA
jgi:hypothetical protein